MYYWHKDTSHQGPKVPSGASESLHRVASCRLLWSRLSREILHQSSSYTVPSKTNTSYLRAILLLLACIILHQSNHSVLQICLYFQCSCSCWVMVFCSLFLLTGSVKLCPLMSIFEVINYNYEHKGSGSAIDNSLSEWTLIHHPMIQQSYLPRYCLHTWQEIWNIAINDDINSSTFAMVYLWQ